VVMLRHMLQSLTTAVTTSNPEATTVHASAGDGRARRELSDGHTATERQRAGPRHALIGVTPRRGRLLVACERGSLVGA
jgi:hypothetical protein